MKRLSDEEIKNNIISIKRVGSSLYKDNPHDIDFVVYIKEDMPIQDKAKVNRTIQDNWDRQVHVEYVMSLGGRSYNND